MGLGCRSTASVSLDNLYASDLGNSLQKDKCDGVGMHVKAVVAKMSVTVGKEGGPMKASAMLEEVASSESQKIGHKKQEVKNNYNGGISHVPLQPSAHKRGTDQSGCCPSRINLMMPRNTCVGSNTDGVHTLGLSNELNIRTHIFLSMKNIAYMKHPACHKRIYYGTWTAKC
jgi:hypothetical protein